MPASSASVSFPSYGAVEEAPRDIQIVQEEYRHDIAVYTVDRRKRFYGYATGTPVHIGWALGRESASFHGYVHHIEPGREGELQVWCRGASSLMDEGLQAVFANRTLPSVVRELARLLHLDVEVEEHGQVFSIVGTGTRLWETLVNYAQEIGYSFYVHNTRVALHSRTALIHRYASEAPVLRNIPTTRDHSLYDFSVIEGHALPGEQRARHVLTGLNSRTGGTFSVTGGVAPPQLGRTTTLPQGSLYKNVGPSTPEDARWKVQAMAENARFNITATATGDGSPRVHQTWPVIVSGTDPAYEGLWFVRKVVHRLSSFTQTNYLMDLELGKDGLGSTISIPAVRERRVLAIRNNPQGRPKAAYPPSVLVDGQWRAQWSASSRTFAESSKRVRR